MNPALRIANACRRLPVSWAAVWIVLVSRSLDLDPYEEDPDQLAADLKVLAAELERYPQPTRQGWKDMAPPEGINAGGLDEGDVPDELLPPIGRPLARKLARVLAEVSNVPKNGRNDFHRYDYVTESDLVDHLRGLIAAEGIAILPTISKATTEERKGKNNRVEYLTTIVMDVLLVDGDTGDTMTSTWHGQGTDSGDKGYYKAYTGAMKYFLMKTFMVSTGDDPEQDDQAAPAARSSRMTKRVQMKGPKEYLRELEAAAYSADVNEEEASAFLTLWAQGVAQTDNLLEACAKKGKSGSVARAMIRRLEKMTPENRGSYIRQTISPEEEGAA